MAAAGLGIGGALGAASMAKGAIGAVGSAASMASDIEFLIRYPTFMQRVDEDERSLLLSNTQQLYQRRQNYEHDFRFQTLKLNKLSGSYQKPAITNRDVHEQYTKDIGLGPVTVEIL